MLALDDPRWNDLRTGWRPSRFLPALRRLWGDPTTGPEVVGEFDSENYVFHQYTVYETTLAVVPHFVHAAGRLPPENRTELLGAAGAYALALGVPVSAREVPNPPPFLVADYDHAVRAALPLLGETLLSPLTGPTAEGDLLQLMIALAGFQGQQRVGLTLLKASGWVACRHCEAEFEPLKEWGRGF